MAHEHSHHPLAGSRPRYVRRKLSEPAEDLISQAQISRLQNGQQGFRSGTLVKLAKSLKVPPFRLFITEKEWAKWKRAR